MLGGELKLAPFSLCPQPAATPVMADACRGFPTRPPGCYTGLNT